MSHLYFKTLKTSETGIAMQKLIDEGKVIANKIVTFLEEIGATDRYLHSGVFHTGLGGVQFDTDVDLKIWKSFDRVRHPFFFCPRTNSKAGKALAEKFYSFGKIDRSDINKVIGYGQLFNNCGLFSDKNGEYFGFIIDSEWNHKMPDDCIEITGSEYDKMAKP